MNIRLVMIAITAGSMAAVATAESGKDGQLAKAPTPAPQVPVVLASAADVRRAAPADADHVAQPVRRPAPRVTTCRCGDPQPEPDQQQPDE